MIPRHRTVAPRWNPAIAPRTRDPRADPACRRDRGPATEEEQTAQDGRERPMPSFELPPLRRTPSPIGLSPGSSHSPLSAPDRGRYRRGARKSPVQFNVSLLKANPDNHHSAIAYVRRKPPNRPMRTNRPAKRQKYAGGNYRGFQSFLAKIEMRALSSPLEEQGERGGPYDQFC